MSSSIYQGIGTTPTQLTTTSQQLQGYVTSAEQAATNAGTSQTAAETALDLFDDRFLGAKNSDPTVDNDGNALVDGALYFDSTVNVMKVYDLANTSWLQLNLSTSQQSSVNTLVSVITPTNHIAALGPVATEIATVAGQISPTNNLATVAADATDIGTVAGISSDVTAVAGQISPTNNINTVAQNVTNIGTVAARDTDIGTVAARNTDIIAVAGQISPTNNLATVAGISGNVATVAGDSADIQTLAGVSSDVTTTAGISANVTTVAGISSDVTSAASVSTDITTVAGQISPTNNLSTVAGISANITTVAGISSDVTTVAGNDTNITTVAGNNTNISTVAGNNTNITTLAGISGNVTTLAGISSDVTTLAGISSDVTTVAGISSNVTTVAGDSADIQTIATNINAGTFATKAASGANSDITSLTGITGGVDINGSELILDADGDTSITADTDDQIDFRVGAADKLSVTSAGATIYGNLTATAQSCSIGIKSASNGFSTLKLGDVDDDDAGQIQYQNGDNRMLFTTNTVERMRIQSDGDIGIGTSSPSARLHVNGGELTVTDTNNSILNLTSSTSGNSTINMGDTADADEGKIQYTGMTNKMGFHTSANERMTIDSDGDVGIGTTTPSEKLHVAGNGYFQNTSGYSAVKIVAASNGTSTLTMGDTFDDNIGQIQYNNTYNTMQFTTNNSERMRLSAAGDLGIGTTLPAAAVDVVTTSSGRSIQTRNSSNSRVQMALYYGNSTIRDPLKTNQPGFNFTNGAVIPAGGSMFFSSSDNILDIGASSNRWDDIYATNGTIQTSDANLKQQIAPLTDAEITAAKAISALFKTYKWNSSVEAKGDAARTHAGVVAQEVESAMTAAGLNASDYAFFISTTWWEADVDYPAIEAADAVYDEDGNMVTAAVEAEDAASVPTVFDTAEEAPEGATECNRKGIRYPELLAFIGAATEQRLASIEARLTALEDA
jgi:hypothetical protein